MGGKTRGASLILCAAAALVLLGGCSSSAPPAAQATAAGGIRIAQRARGRADGTPISLTLLVRPRFSTEVLPGERLYRLYYWSRSRRVEAFLDVPAGSGPDAGGGFSLLVGLHGGFVVPTGSHANVYCVTPTLAAESALAQDVVFLPNYRGYCASPGVTGGAYSDYVDTVNGLKALSALRGLRITRDETYLFGASLGGFVALDLAAHDPQVRALVLSSPYPGGQLMMQWLTSPSSGQLDRQDLNILGALPHSYGPDQGSRAWALRSIQYQDVRQPALIIAGTEDPINPPGLMRLLYAELKRSNASDQLEFFHAGHVPETPASKYAEFDWLYSFGLNS